MKEITERRLIPQAARIPPFREGSLVMRGFGRLLDLLVPPLCALCETPLLGNREAEGRAGLCADCHATLPWIDENACPGCARPLPAIPDLGRPSFGIMAEIPIRGHGKAGKANRSALAGDEGIAGPDGQSRLGNLAAHASSEELLSMGPIPAHPLHKWLCEECLADPPPWLLAKSVLHYQESAAQLILAYKHGGLEALAPSLADLLVRRCRTLFEEGDIILPVPSSRRRIATRGFDHIALLADRVARKTGRPARSDLLRRIRHAPMQHRLTGEARRRIPAGTMALSPSAISVLEGRRVILIDDVLTTGATMREAARAVAMARPATICISTLACAAFDD